MSLNEARKAYKKGKMKMNTRVEADSKKYCPLLNREIRRAYCYEVGEVREDREDNVDIEHIEDRFDIDEANKICNKCGWYMIGIY